MGEERNVECKDPEVSLGADLTPVDIHRIAECLKSIERNAQGEDELEDGQRGVYVDDPKGLLDIPRKEVQVLVREEHRETGSDSHREKGPPRADSADSFHTQSGYVVDQGDGNDQDDVFYLPAHVEEITGSEEKHPSTLCGEGEEECDHEDVEEKELERVEEHGLRFVLRIPSSGQGRCLFLNAAW